MAYFFSDQSDNMLSRPAMSSFTAVFLASAIHITGHVLTFLTRYAENRERARMADTIEALGPHIAKDIGWPDLYEEQVQRRRKASKRVISDTFPDLVK